MMKYKEVGGSSAGQGLSNDWIKFLQSGLQTGSFGAAGATSQANAANPYGSTAGIGGILNDLLAGGAGKVGGSMADLISHQANEDALSLRARYGAGGGSAFGTPAAYAEAVLRSNTAPKIVSAVGGLQENALAQLLPLFSQVYGRETTQRQGTYQQNPWASAAQIGLPIAGSVIGSIGGPGGAAAGAKIGSTVASGFAPPPPVNFDSMFTMPSSYTLGQGLTGSPAPNYGTPYAYPGFNFGDVPSLRY